MKNTRSTSKLLVSALLGLLAGGVALAGLETVTHISDLNSSWPLGTDLASTADDHIRNIKVALKTDFPNINGTGGSASAPPFAIPGDPNTGMWGVSADVLGFATGGTARGQVNSTGNWTIPAPTAGIAFDITGLSGASAVARLNAAGTADFSMVVNGASTGQSAIEFDVNSAAKGYVGFSGAAGQIITGSASGDALVRTQGGGFRVSVDSGATSALNITTGALVQAKDQGATLQDVGWRDMPQNAVSGGYTLALSDRGKMVMSNSGNITIPANASVAFPLGSTITIVNNTVGTITIAITTDTMVIAGTGTTGTRTLASNGIATIVKFLSTEWLITGTGVT